MARFRVWSPRRHLLATPIRVFLIHQVKEMLTSLPSFKKVSSEVKRSPDDNVHGLFDILVAVYVSKRVAGTMLSGCAIINQSTGSDGDPRRTTILLLCGLPDTARVSYHDYSKGQYKEDLCQLHRSTHSLSFWYLSSDTLNATRLNTKFYSSGSNNAPSPYHVP